MFNFAELKELRITDKIIIDFSRRPHSKEISSTARTCNQRHLLGLRNKQKYTAWRSCALFCFPPADAQEESTRVRWYSNFRFSQLQHWNESYRTAWTSSNCFHLGTAEDRPHVVNLRSSIYPRLSHSSKLRERAMRNISGFLFGKETTTPSGTCNHRLPQRAHWEINNLQGRKLQSSA